MFKRVLTLLICISVVLCIAPTSLASEVSAEGCDFDDRILYGGTAVDVGSDTVVSEKGSLWYFDSVLGEKVKIANVDARYLNYASGRLWFVSQNKIMSCLPDGSGLCCIREFDGEEVSCLYVVDGGVFYLRGETVCSFNGSIERELFSREGIEGFVPQSDGSFRWVEANPDYIPVDESSGEVWADSEPIYLSYIASGSDAEGDTEVTLSPYATATEVSANASNYTGPYVEVGDVTLPLDYHMPGTFFSKNGQACVCHHTSSNYCIQSVGNCNCMRYYPTGYKETCEIDLLGAQCFAFARMVFYTCFGFIDHPMNSSLYYNVGGLSSGAVTANSVKALLMKAKTGAHIRLSAGHSVSILTMDEDFIVIYHGNAGGDGVVSQPCIISTRRYTWQQFANACAAGIEYVNMPYNHPDASIKPIKQEVGYYKLTSNLNLRAETNVESESLAIIPINTIIPVTEIDGFWGKTTYNGTTGWAFIAYMTYYSQLGITPSSDTFVLDDDGLLRAASWKMNFDAFSEHFDKQSIVVTDADGNAIPNGDYIGTGSKVTLIVDGEIIDEATVCLAGDLNGNASMDVGDYLMIRRYAMGIYDLEDIQFSAGDVNGDDAVDAFDYACVRRFFFDPDPEFLSGFME